ncbi:hypothetical protein FQN57_004655 [Myotisia sp. PD_48]|nr:hypothetical protein FQN57_004655 [Myotisia sp. PD_48]
MAYPSSFEGQVHYPPGLRLELVQVFFRHGERTPTATRFQNAGLPSLWPFCSATHAFNALFKSEDTCTVPLGGEELGRGEPSSGYNRPGLCGLGELTDKGRESTLALGRQLRQLYITKLGFLPDRLTAPHIIYLRSTRYQRTFSSLQQVFSGLYPKQYLDISMKSLPVLVVNAKDETLLPNEDWCPRFIDMLKAFSRKTAMKWNGTPELEHINILIRRWMPNGQKVAIDSEPKLAGILDTINSVSALPEPTKYLPREFFDDKSRQAMEKIVSEEEFGGYAESNEFRALGVGVPLSLVLERMRNMVKYRTDISEDKESVSSFTTNEGKEPPRLALFACHDSTIAGILVALGVMRGPKWFWPPYAASLSFELFFKPEESELERRKHPEYEAKTPRNRFVRVKYMDKPVTLPTCQLPGKHLPGDKTMCTLTAFKEIIDDITPKDWKQQWFDKLIIPFALDEDIELEDKKKIVRDFINLEEKIVLLQGVMSLSGGLMLAGLAGGPIGLIVSALAIENEIEDKQKEQRLVQEARIELTRLRNDHLETINNDITLLHDYWQKVVGDAQYLLEYLPGADDVEIPEFLDDYINEGVRVYQELSEYVDGYAAGISGVLGTA